MHFACPNPGRAQCNIGPTPISSGIPLFRGFPTRDGTRVLPAASQASQRVLRLQCRGHPKEGSMHVIIDGYGGEPEQPSDENEGWVVLDPYPEMMGMTKITQPTVIRYRGTKPEDWGVSGYVM